MGKLALVVGITVPSDETITEPRVYIGSVMIFQDHRAPLSPVPHVIASPSTAQIEGVSAGSARASSVKVVRAVALGRHSRVVPALTRGESHAWESAGTLAKRNSSPARFPCRGHATLSWARRSWMQSPLGLG